MLSVILLCVFSITVDIGTARAACPLNIADGDVTGLVNAINCANGSPADDVISLATNGTYTLTAVNNTNPGIGDNGLPVIAPVGTAGTLTIHGNNATITRSGASPSPFRILEVGPGGSLLLDHITISGGNMFGGSFPGAGIFNYSGVLVLMDSTVSGNSTAGQGGGIANGGSLTVINSTISGNSAANGGGIFNSSSLTLQSSTVSNNWGATSGGGVYTTSGSTITNSTFASNTAQALGGGLYNGGSVTLSSSTFSLNYVFNASGGGIYNASGTMTLNNSIIARSTHGGDCANSGTFNTAYSLIQDGSCGIGTGPTYANGNRSGDPLYDPSGLQNNGGSTRTIALQAGSPAINTGDPAFASPPAYDQRGIGFPRVLDGRIDMGAYEGSLPAVQLQVDTISDNYLANCTPVAGDCSLRGAIDRANTAPGREEITFDPAVFSTPRIISLSGPLPHITSDITITGPGQATLTVDGANSYRIFLIDANVSLSGLTVAHGRDYAGAGIYLQTGSLSLTNVGVVDNTATSSDGGGILNNGLLTVTDSTISGNSAAGWAGGIMNWGTLTVVNTTFAGNSGWVAGGIYNLNATATVIASIFTGNLSAHRGGAIVNENGALLTVTNTTFADNVASSENGGAISNINGALTVSGSTFVNNSASSGGAISNNGSSTLSVSNSTFADNVAGVGLGGGIYDTDAPVSVRNSTFSGNSGVAGSGGLANDNGSLTLSNSLLADNIGGDCSILRTGSGDVSHSLIADGSCGVGTGPTYTNGNLSGDPLLDAAGLTENGGLTQTIALQPDSPAIDAGDNTLALDVDGVTSLGFDQRGASFPRIIGGVVDIGAYEAAAAAETSGSISGHIYQADGTTPVTIDMWMNADPVNAPQGWGMAVNPNPDGSYTITGVTPGDYHLSMVGGDYAQEFYDEAGAYGDHATAVTITAGVNTPNIDFTLDPGGEISGTVYESDGVTPIANQVVIENIWFGTCTDANGHYTLKNLPLNVPLKVNTDWDNWCAPAQNHVGEWWQEAADEIGATAITLTEASPSQSGVDFTLDPGASITGHIYEADGVTPITSGVLLSVERTDGLLSWHGDGVNPDGSYAILRLPAGSYRVQASGDAYAREYYDDAGINSSNATIITVTTGEAVSGIDFALAAGGSISGHIYEADGVTPLAAGAWVEARDFSTSTIVAGTASAANGSYKISGLPVGQYQVYVYSGGYAFQLYHDVVFLDDAQPVTVTASTETTGIDFAMHPGGTISGHVTDVDGQPLSNVNVGVMPVSWIGACTDANGDYTIYNVPFDTNFDLFAGGPLDWCGGGSAYTTEWWQEAATEALATPVAASQATPNVEGIDFTLASVVTPGAATLTFDSLPSAQGWIYSDPGAGNPEAASFSVSGGQLHQTVYAQGIYSTPHYELHGVVIPDQPFTLTVRARVTNYNETNGNPWGFSIYVFAASEQYSLGISPARIVGGSVDIPFSFDVGKFHNYRMEGMPGSGYQLFVDDVLLGTVPAEALSVSPNYLQIGDGTGGARADVDIEAFSFQNYPPPFAGLLVDTTSDDDLEGCTVLPGDCSLRGAITLANAQPDADTITFEPSVFGTSQTIYLNADLPQIIASVNIVGVGANLLTIDGATSHRPFSIADGATASISDLTIAHGSAVFGGGIQNLGSLTVTSVTFSANAATTGGGIHNGGALLVSGSTFSGNSASGYEGGGAIFHGFGTATVLNSTFSSNNAVQRGGGISNWSPMTVTDSMFAGNIVSSGNGGGIYNWFSPLTVNSSTFTDNTASSGGGISNTNSGTVIVVNSTFAANIASIGVGGGIYNYNSPLTVTDSTFADNMAAAGSGGITHDGVSNPWLMTLNNTIAADNTGGDCAILGAAIIDMSHSLIKDGSCGAANGLNGNLSGDPQLAPAGLANNGGATQTIALQPGSPAIDAGDNTLAVDAFDNPLAYDQRGAGFPRVVGDAVDMGAFEAEASSTCLDVPAGDVNALINAIHSANANPDVTRICFPWGSYYPLHGVDNYADGPNGLPVITSPIVIDGNDSAIMHASGTPFRIFHVAATGSLTVTRLHILNGYLDGGNGLGAGFYNAGELSVTESCLVGNVADAAGGIYNASGSAVNAISNWWGHPQGPSGNGFGSGDGISANVNYEDFKSIAPPGCGPVITPDNDLLGSPTEVTELPYTTSQDVFGATHNANEPNLSCAIDNVADTVWYHYTAANNAVLSLDTFGSSYNTVLAIYSGAYAGSYAGFTELACSDDVAGGSQSAVELDVEAGTSYFIQIAKYGISPLTGSGFLTLNASAEITSGPNLVTNGDFGDGTNYWTFYGPTDYWAPGGLLQFKHRDHSAPGGFFQPTAFALPTDAPVEVTVELGNTGGFDKQVLIRLSEGDDTNPVECVFTVDKATPLQPYVLRGLSPGWSNVKVTVEELTFDGYPDVLLDNLDVRYQPGLSVSGIECVEPTATAAPADSDLVRNGTFSDGDKQWVRWGAVDAWVPVDMLLFKATGTPGGFFQNLLHTLPAGAPVEVVLQLGNTSDVMKTAQVVLNDGVSWDDARVCNFAVLPHTPLQTYTLRAQTTVAWADIRLEVNPGPPDGIPDLLLDNVAASYRPSLSAPVTECVSPPAPTAPADTNLVRNGTFVSGENSWTHWGDLDVWAPDETLYTKLRSGGTGGSIFQDLSYALPAGAPVEVTLRLGNPGWADKTVDIVLHDPGWSEVVTCQFALGAYTDFASYTIRGMTAGSWSDLRLELVPGPADGIPDVHVDDVSVAYRPGLSVSGTECLEPGGGAAGATETVAAPVEETQEATPEEVATALPFPTLGVPEQPPEQSTAVPTIVPQPVPVVASMDDGAPDWQGVSGWVLTSEAAYGGAGLGWTTSTTSQVDVLRWLRPLDLRSVAGGSEVVLGYASRLSGVGSSASVQVSLDGTTWVTVGVAAATGDWQQEQVELSAYAGQLVWVQMVWVGGLPTNDGQGAGSWWVDEVSVMVVAAVSTPLPTATAMPTIEPTATPLPTETPTVEPTTMPTVEPSPEATEVVSSG
ncbi:MAG: choice-of-anchor Q domain-containing protein [Anaerolineae bacterium]